MKMKEEEMKVNKIKGLVPVLKFLFVLLCVAVFVIAVNAEAFAGDINGADFLKSEAGYIGQENTDPVLDERGIIEDSKKNNLLSDGPFQYEISQNDKGEESADNVNEKEDGVKEQSGDKGNGSGVVFEPIQYCQGRFKRLGGTGVEIITIRCPKVDDSCSCEGEKKGPTKWVECGGVRKDSTIGSDLLSCESKIVGSGGAANSE
jgi:hypothetical protein